MAVAYQLDGINFSPYLDGQDPNRRDLISEDQLRARMAIVVPNANLIRTFGMADGLEKAGRIAHEMGREVALGAWLGRSAADNEQQITNLIAAINSGDGNLAIVGSEVLLRGDLPEVTLIGYINRVRTETNARVPVATADVYGVFLTHPALVDAVDVVLPNYYPYWEGIGLSRAVAALHDWHQQLLALAGEKPIIVSETGWPSCGDPVGDAVPSPENAAYYFLNFVSWARANDVPYLYFSSYDESWKVASEGPQGACWGVWDKLGSLKPGMQAVFDGATMPDNWSGQELVDGAGTPAIALTTVPPYGSDSTQLLKGRVSHIRPIDYRVVVYIFAPCTGGWWGPKPTFLQPLTRIYPDGSWSTQIVTGGCDAQATRISAFVVPRAYNPPNLLNAPSLPPDLAANAVASTEVTRAP